MATAAGATTGTAGAASSLGNVAEVEMLDPRALVDPTSLRILLIDSNTTCQESVQSLLCECSYQVKSTRTSKEALELLNKNVAETEEPGFDLILKDHEPPRVNGCRLLRKLSQIQQLKKIPVVVMSSQDDRNTVVKCLHLGAADYLVKPLRHNELRNLWTRVWWRRVVNTFRPSDLNFLARGGPSSNPVPELRDHGYPSPPATSSLSEETKCDEEEPTSKEGSAPVGEGSGGKGSGEGSGGGSGGLAASRAPRHLLAEDCNGNSDSKNGNGNSATKNGNGSGGNGNGGSTTHAPDVALDLRGTAQGGAKAAALRAFSYKDTGAKGGASAAELASMATPSSRSGPAGQAKREGSRVQTNSSKRSHSAHLSDGGHLRFNQTSDVDGQGPLQQRKVESADPLGQVVVSRRHSGGGPNKEARQTATSPGPATEAAASEDTNLTRVVSGVPSVRMLSSPGKLNGATPSPVPRDGKGQGNGPNGGSYMGVQSESRKLPWQGSSHQHSHMAPSQLHSGMQNPYSAWSQNPLDIMRAGSYNPYTMYMMQQPSPAGSAPLHEHMAAQAAAHQNWVHNAFDPKTKSRAQHQNPWHQPPSSGPPYPPGGYDSRPMPGGYPPSYSGRGMVPSHMDYPYPHGRGSSQNQGKNPWSYMYPGMHVLQPPGAPQQRGSEGQGKLQPSSHHYGDPGPPPAPGGKLDEVPRRIDPPSKHNFASGAPEPEGATNDPAGDLLDPRISRKERQAAALHKFRMKRKNLCFTKKIRYASRKQLAEARPRIKGQFVRQDPNKKAADLETEDQTQDLAEEDDAPATEEYALDVEEDEEPEEGDEQVDEDDEDEHMTQAHSRMRHHHHESQRGDSGQQGENRGLNRNGGSDSGSNSPDENRHS